jgi:hypothetical protein
VTETRLYVLNFGHPLSAETLAALEPATEIRVPFQAGMDPGSEPTPFQVQRKVHRAAELLRRSGLRLDGSCPVAVVPHGLSEVTALLMAELHGRLGGFPRVLALRRGPDGVYRLADEARYPGMFGGVLDLEKVRQAARERR